MDLFDNSPDETKNLLPKDGTLNYYGKLLPKKDANNYFEKLLTNIQWKNDEAIIFGNKIITKRKVAWNGQRSFEYTYSNAANLALLWIKELVESKALIEQKTGEAFNSCLLNL